LNGGGGNNIMIGGAGNDNFIGDVTIDLMIGETGTVTMSGNMVQSVTVSGVPLNLLAFTESGLFSSASVQSLGKGFDESYSGTRRSDAEGFNAFSDGSADTAGTWQAPELSHHSLSMMTSQNMQQIIDFFQELEFEDDDSENPESEQLEDKVEPQLITGGSRTEKSDTGDKPLHKALLYGKKKINNTEVESEGDNALLGTLVAGYMGWNVNSGLPSDRKTRINRDSFTKLEREERRRRFVKWN